MNLKTRYMGLTLKNPLVASASPLSQRLETIRQLEDCGASAVVMFSLFEEQIRHDAGALDYFMTVGTDSFGEALSYFPVVEGCEVGTDAVPRADSQSLGGGRHPDHRQPERHDRSRLDRLCHVDGGGRRAGPSS